MARCLVTVILTCIKIDLERTNKMADLSDILYEDTSSGGAICIKKNGYRTASTLYEGCVSHVVEYEKMVVFMFNDECQIFFKRSKALWGGNYVKIIEYGNFLFLWRVSFDDYKLLVHNLRTGMHECLEIIIDKNVYESTDPLVLLARYLNDNKISYDSTLVNYGKNITYDSVPEVPKINRKRLHDVIFIATE